jgi:ribosomal protein S18 acetylase RimI-like enzyme
MTLAIRPARATDLEFLVEGNALLALETEGRELDRDLLAEGVALALADEARGRYFLADDGEEPIGQLLVTREWSDWRAGWFWWVCSIYVVPAARGRGVFTLLWQHLLSLAQRDPEVCGIRLYVDERNDAALAVYDRIGMRDAGYRVFEVDFTPRAGAAVPD